MTHCQHCGATNSNGLALCDLCRYLAAQCLEKLPIYFRNLARQRRPGRPNGSLGGNGQWLIRRGETDTNRIEPALGHVLNDLTTYARGLADDRGIEEPTGDNEAAIVTAVCDWLTEHLTSIATLEWAGIFVRDIGKHETRLRELTETVVPGWYAGACQHVTGRTMEGDLCRCEADIFVVPGLTWVTCGRCGNTSHAADHLETVLKEAEDWVARPMRIAEAIVALVHSEQSIPRLYERIKKWEQRERIKSLRHTTRDHVWDDEAKRIIVAEVPTGHARYRMGDVLEQVLTTRSEAETDENTAAAS